ncbi:hypothetical protein SAMN05216317_11428 [Nitrosomonas eutropha]|uniref:hypothetical protein n=1 Tax=Nitrosomonas TaxID=914 RepID=UPI000895AC67|nr:hypothetical protein [Nitrosomonas eutropha]MXS79400.1 hypothetical protein [Nitrosomonas sp. GH22]SDW82456.1 hypothetical protein SAMN05216317_11428 [Nitrosomonas eutropha]
MGTRRSNFAVYAGLLFLLTSSTAGWAQDISEIQRQFNTEILNKPFSVPSDAELTSALKEATLKGKSSIAPSHTPACVGPGCTTGGNYGYGSYFGGYARPYYGGYYGLNRYLPFYYGW